MRFDLIQTFDVAMKEKSEIKNDGDYFMSSDCSERFEDLDRKGLCSLVSAQKRDRVGFDLRFESGS
jgi:hypothetical protein